MFQHARPQLLSFGLAVGLSFTAIGTATAFVEDTPPTSANGSIDPNQTADAAAVAAAQRALTDFFAYTNLTYSIAGYANPRLMREDLGNSETDWLDKTMPLACGRLLSGWKGMNWIPARGWSHSAPSGASTIVAPSSCLYSPPVVGNGGADPSATADPAAVAAAQQALSDFYASTNLNYSQLGYANPQVMREIIGNSVNDWLDQALNLARGRLVGGWKFMNWVPGKGWCHCAAPPSPPVRSRTQDNAVYYGWDASLPQERDALPRTIPSRLGSLGTDAETLRVVQQASRIKDGLGLSLGG